MLEVENQITYILRRFKHVQTNSVKKFIGQHPDALGRTSKSSSRLAEVWLS